MKYDVLVIGELNVDIILNRIDSFPEMGKEKIAEKMTTTLGSSSAIFASNISSLGVKVSFLGKIGDDNYGGIIIDRLRAKGVNTDLIVISQEFNTGATVVLNFNEDRAMVTYPGAMDHLGIGDISDEQLSQAKHLHFSSCFLQPGIKSHLPELFKRAKSLGLTTSLDPQWDPAEDWKLDLKNILPNVDVFLPNEKELMLLTNTLDVESAIDAVKDIVNCLVVKMGNKGSMVYEKGNKSLMKPYLNDKVVDAIGAGDSFNAGFIFKYTKGVDIKECQKFGNLTGAISTTRSGGTTAFSNYENIMKIAQKKFNYK